MYPIYSIKGPQISPGISTFFLLLLFFNLRPPYWHILFLNAPIIGQMIILRKKPKLDRPIGQNN